MSTRTIAFTAERGRPLSLNPRMILRQRADLIVEGVPVEYSDAEALEILRALLSEQIIEYSRARWRTAIQEGIVAGVLQEVEVPG